MDLLKLYLVENAKIYQHQKFYSRYDKIGVENRLVFELCYKEWINNRENLETRVSCYQKTSIKQAEVDKNPKNHKQRPGLTITEFKQV